ncbi:bifunctional fructose-2,6-bisphosphate 2-phosphatase/6-phosphofructo-2-kinase [Sugiyamaella lignohabitans]|uniref:Bifunctional fructose-2,6-bisphosphate 2-phosphatase/6-phosphofructo-2-kinase n=1 Tax=Sugiyamaella lignohabitans TaxID=796027 RepID=A0A167DEM9_9ASCO|nr:bifunctional fructose-2,6-bisphosphate 2-phosphatase/6-phosphofructo-2-kinase [Sugiyamaella lignohabitans]ANB12830.1 bifunctional fructose-2,6-bisphosphate 2-phosphatase/6-phosphofructo-2-kinase [Sugiyamaella lignohabitans]
MSSNLPDTFHDSDSDSDSNSNSHGSTKSSTYESGKDNVTGVTSTPPRKPIELTVSTVGVSGTPGSGTTFTVPISPSATSPASGRSASSPTVTNKPSFNDLSSGLGGISIASTAGSRVGGGTTGTGDSGNINRSKLDPVPSFTILPQKKTTRRNSDVDAIHRSLPKSHVSPAQLYSTDSGHLYHAGKLCIVLVGLPARGKTHHAVALTRYLRWLGVKTHAFHLGDYRRKLTPKDFRVPDDYFMPNASKETKAFRQKVEAACLADMFKFYDEENGQVVIYDAVNGTSAKRRALAKTMTDRNVGVLFVECFFTDKNLVARNVRDVKISSPDYQGMDPDEAVKHYLRRIELRIPDYETMTETELTYVKLVNVSERFIINYGERHLGYLFNRIIFFLMNSRIKVGSVFFARAGSGNASNEEDDYKSDGHLSGKGEEYAEKLKETLWAHIDERRLKLAQISAPDLALDKKLQRQARVAHEVLRSSMSSGTGTDFMENISPPVTSGTSTPNSSADARAISTIRADALNFQDKSNVTVWCSTRLRTVQTAERFAQEGNKTIQRSLLNQLNPGVAGGLTEAGLKEEFPYEYLRHQQDPYHHRYPRAESYQDVAVRLESLILEMERTQGDLLIICHETVLRVLYGYLMACSVEDIPFLRFPRNEIVEIVPNAYINQGNRITIPNVDP